MFNPPLKITFHRLIIAGNRFKLARGRNQRGETAVANRWTEGITASG